MSTTITHIKNKKMIAPKLRFKGFNDEWINIRLKDLTSLITKGTTPQSFSKNGINYVKIEGLDGVNINKEKCLYIDEQTHNKELRRSILHNNDLLFAIAGATIGKVAIVTDDILPANTNQALAIIRLKNTKNLKYVLQILQSRIMKKYIQESISVGAQPNLNLEQMGDFKFHMPSIPEQQKIASFLSAVDEKIQLLHRKKQLLEQYKKGVMQQLFSGKLRFKGHTDKWKKVVFTECCDLIHGFQFREEHFVSTGLPVIKIGSLVDNGSISFHNATYVSKDCEQTHSKFILKKGDVLMALTGGTLGKVSLIDKDYGVIFQNYRVGKFENKSNSTKEYIYFLLQSNLVQNRIQSLVNEAAQPNFGKQDFDKIKFSLPSIEEQKKIADFLSAIDVKIESLSKQISQTQNFKKGLLQQMFV
jgi:type I restriction enzyme S subunit